MRVTTAFNRMLAVPGASVTSVSFGADGVVVRLRRRSRRLDGASGAGATSILAPSAAISSRSCAASPAPVAAGS
jgi:hypothetical protein